MGKHYSNNLKQQIICMHQNGVPVKELCKKFNVSKSSIYNWKEQYQTIVSRSGQVTTSRKAYLLQKQVNRLELENDILKRSGCTLSSPLKDKLEAIAQLQEDFSIHILCRTLNVLRSTFYHHLRKQQTWFAKEEEMLKPKIIEIYEQSKQRYGSKKICAMLKREGIIASKERVSRLMKDMGLSVPATKPRRIYSKENKDNGLENKLNQEFKQDSPNRVWVSDISYIKIGKDAPLYICVVIDLFSRKVIAYRISDECDSYFAIATFKEAYTKRNKPEFLMFHSDRGAQYTSYEFRKYLREHSVEQSFSNTGYPYDNAVSESFFATMKKEQLYRNEYTSILQLRKDVKEYIDFFNKERIHESMGYLTPNEVEATYSA